LLLRSIKTLAIRVERAQENALKVASFLSRHPAVTRLHYAGPIPNPKQERYVAWGKNKWLAGHHGATADPTQRLEVKQINISMSHKQHKLHMTQARGGGSVMSFETGNVEFSKRIVDACRLFKITVSFGSCNSLIELPCLLSHASIPEKDRTLPPDLIRISVGIESADDILQDLERAFRCAASDVENVRSIKASFSQLENIRLKDIAEDTG
jgi:cysteine-S-conjugate beta-lyase